MRIVQGIRHFACDLERVVDRQLVLPGEPLPQRVSLDIGHDIVDQAIDLIGVVERQDMGMVKASRDLNLTQEPGGSHLGGQVGAEHLYGDRALVLEVVGQEYLGHAALPQLSLDLVPRGEDLVEALQQLRHYRSPLSEHEFRTVGTEPEKPTRQNPPEGEGRARRGTETAEPTNRAAGIELA